MQRKIDVRVPFIAIRQDLKGDEYKPTMGEYLCNPLSEDLLDVSVSTGGFYSDDELGVVEANESEKKPSFVVPAGKAVRFTLSTRDEYDELVCHWTVCYRTTTSERVAIDFGTFKRLEDTQYFAEVPVLGGPGKVVPLSL
jgi:hypothetical protein